MKRALPAMKTDTSARPAAHSPGRARFHGNGIGGGAAALRRTASMTDVTKPDDGTISCSVDRIRSRSPCLISPPSPLMAFSLAALKIAVTIYYVAFHAHEIVSPSRFLPAVPDSARLRRCPCRGNRKESWSLDTSAEVRRPRGARRDPAPHSLALRL